MNSAADGNARADASVGAGTEKLLDAAALLLPGGGLGPTDVTLRSLRPAVLAKGEGAYLTTSDGDTFLDFVMGGSALILGHCPAPVIAAIEAQVPLGTHYYQILHAPAVRMAELMIGAIGWAEQLVYTSTGSDAVNQAIRLARAASGRELVVKFAGPYHGTGDVALVNMSSPAGRNHDHADGAGVPRGAVHGVKVLGLGDLASVERLLASRAEEIACVLIDPLQRWIRPSADFLAGLRALCDRFGILLVFDEVVTGFRLAYGGAAAHFGLAPDIAAYGKIIGGGLPLGAFAASRKLMEAANPALRSGDQLVTTTGTFNANVLSCAAGAATLECLAEPGLYDSLEAKGESLRAGYARYSRGIRSRRW